MGMWQHWLAGDAVTRAVAMVLLLMSVSTWVVVLWKVWLLRSAGGQVARAVAVFWQSAAWSEARDRVQSCDPAAWLTPLVDAAMATTPSQAATAPASLARSAPLEQRLTRDLRSALVAAQHRLQFGQVLLASVGATAPFVGLLGTVWGIYRALLGLGLEGPVGLEQVAGPVGEALVMTAAGLAVALPAVLAYNVLGRWAARTEAALEAFAHDVRAWVLAQPSPVSPLS